MKLSKLDCLYVFLILITSVATVFDLFFTIGRPATFDAPFHITNIAQFYSALNAGDFPVVWADGFANYGLPIPVVAHQFTSYLGAFLLIFIKNPELAYNILIFIGIFLSCLFYYCFLRIYFSPVVAFVAMYLFNFSAYRIINVYIRGAMPEIFSALFLPLILIGMHILIEKKKIVGLFLLLFSIFGLVLNHPMMVLIYSFVFFPYLFFLLVKNGFINSKRQIRIENIKLFVATMMGVIIGIGMASYYLIPLVVEIKYFYYGLINNHLTPDSYLHFLSYVNQNWYYFTQNDVFTRGHVIKLGAFETLLIAGGLSYVVWSFLMKRQKGISLLVFAVFTSIFIIFFTSEYSEIFYKNISVLSNIQFPWRMLSALIFLPPIIAAYFLQKINNKVVMVIVIIVISIISFPQLYGKNFVVNKQDIYFFTTHNVHSVLMNTIWTGKTEEYSVKQKKGDIIDGKGKIMSRDETNSQRMFAVAAQTPIRMVDYTFYFPGWKVYVDGNPVVIEYQDPKYRGVITYTVPVGNHQIRVRFEDTKIRLLGKLLSVFFIFLCSIAIIFRKKIGVLLYKTTL